MSTQHWTDTQASLGAGVQGFSTTIPDGDLKVFENQNLVGENTTLHNAVDAIRSAGRLLTTLGQATHPAGLWTIVVPTKHLRALIFSIVRVEGRQRSLLEVDDVGEVVRIEKAKGKAKLAEAEKIRDQLSGGGIEFAEDLEVALSKTSDPEGVRTLLQAFGPKAHRVRDGNRPTLSLTGEEVPKSLLSRDGFRLRVRVSGGVNTDRQTVGLTVDQHLDGKTTFRDFHAALLVECQVPKHQAILLAAQITGQTVDVVLSGEVNLFPLKGSQSHRLSVVSVVPTIGSRALLHLLTMHQKDLFEDGTEGSETS